MNRKILLIFTFMLLGVVSCNSRKDLCFKSDSKKNFDLSTLNIDTNAVYVKEYIVDKVDNNESLFIKETNSLLKETKPCIKFYSNGKFAFYQELKAFEELKKPTYGVYFVSNDTLFLCRKHYSVQSGNYYDSSVFIVKDSMLIEINDNNNSFYKKMMFNNIKAQTH